MARKNPVVSKEAGPVPELDGAEIAFPSGVQPQRWPNDKPNMSKNDGAGPSIKDAPFANGKDLRNPPNAAPSTPISGLGM
jgi:hypothetical protein